MSGVREFGVVVALSGTTVRIRISPASEDACATCGGCAPAEPGGSRLLETDPVEGLAVGDRVLVETAPVSRLSASLLLLLVPLLGLLIGAIVGQAVGARLGLGPESGAIVLGLALLVLSYLAVAWLDRRFRSRRGGSAPRIVTIQGDGCAHPLDDSVLLG